MNFEQKKNQLFDDMHQQIDELVQALGENTSNVGRPVLKIEKDFWKGVPNVHYAACFNEINSDSLFCTVGHSYSYDTMDIEDLCEVIDHVIEKYNRPFRVMWEVVEDDQYVKMYEYFNTNEDAYDFFIEKRSESVTQEDFYGDVAVQKRMEGYEFESTDYYDAMEDDDDDNPRDITSLLTK